MNDGCMENATVTRRHHFLALTVRATMVEARGGGGGGGAPSPAPTDSALGESPLSLSPAGSSAGGGTSPRRHAAPPLPASLVRMSYAVVTRSEGQPTCQSDATQMDVMAEELPQRLHEIAESLYAIYSPKTLLVAGVEDIRQTLYPLFAGTAIAPSSASEADCSDLQAMPQLFHSFAVFPTAGAPLDALTRYVSEESIETLLERIEYVRQSYVPTVCCETSVDSALIVRARGLPWQASDFDIGRFFAGLNIAAGGIALCLSAEGRRNGEALVRFESAGQRELALRRNRHFLHGRYIEVYRATGDEFVRVAVGGLGADAEVVRFVSREAAMIVRMRGLPFHTTEQQIRDFFAPSSVDESEDGTTASAAADAGIVEPGGILFVNRADGRPSGDAFVLFASEAAGRLALGKHKHRIGQRYVELFRTTQAEVQQLFNRTLHHPPPQAHLHQVQQQVIPHQPHSQQQQVKFGALAPRRDCVRLRGLPYEAQVKQVVDFLGDHARNVVFQGVHMIYNNQGHPSGEAFIQMNSEAAAATAAQAIHNKYMELGKKKRYIEVFQCSPEDINVLLNSPVFPTGAVPTRGSPTGPAALIPTPPIGTLPSNIIPMGLVANNFMPFGAQTPIFRAGFTPLMASPLGSAQPTAGAPQTQPPQPPQPISANLVYNGGPTTLINTSSAANSQQQVVTAAANFCFPALSAAVPPPFGAMPTTTTAIISTTDHLEQVGQYPQMPFFHVDPNNPLAAFQTAAFINLQQQQQLFGKTQFYSLGAALPATTLAQFPSGAVTYPMQFIANCSTNATAPTIANGGATPKLDANGNTGTDSNSNGPLDMAAAAAVVSIGIPHKPPFTLIHT